MSGTTIPSEPRFGSTDNRYAQPGDLEHMGGNRYSGNVPSSGLPSSGSRYTNSVDVDGDTIRNTPQLHNNMEKKFEYADGENGVNGGSGLPTYRVPSNVVDTQDAKPKQSMMTRMAHSFRRREDAVTLNALGQRVVKDDVGGEKGLAPGQELPPDAPGGPVGNDTSRLNRKLKGRHMQMIAIGGSIGTGLFIGSGSALASGGPAALMIDFGIVGIMLFCVIHALGELAVLFPISGSFSVYSTRFIDPAWGFSMGWNYAMQWLVVLPLELTAAGITIQYWNSNVNVGVFITIFLFALTLINIAGVRGYGEAEFVFSTIKVIAVIGFIILGIVIDCGGAPVGGYLGAHTWHDPGAFANGFKGVCSVFVTAAFAFAGTELVGLAAAECENPRKQLPRATKQVFWRITLFYMISLFLVGLIVPYNNPQLLNGTSSVDVKASPFVIAIQNAGINVLPSIFNAVILISVLSVGNSSTYGSTRTLAALAEIGQAPRIFAYIDKKGRPLVALVLALALGCLAYINIAPVGPAVFNWLLALSGLSNFFTWGSICFAHIRFRKAWVLQGNTLDEIPFRAAFGIWGSWLGLILCILCLIAQFYVALFPIGGEPNASAFFQAYLACPIIFAFYIFWKFFKKTRIVKLQEADLQSGRRELNLKELKAQEREEQAHWSKAKKIYYWFC